jgi:hypothetical protein
MVCWIFFNNKSEEGVNVDVAVNDHHDENLDHYSKLDINDYQHQCLKNQENNDQGVHGGDYGDLIPTFDENLLNPHQLIDRRQMRDNDYDCQRLVESKIREARCVITTKVINVWWRLVRILKISTI